MKIIKPGNICHTKRFTCERCGCIWEAEKGEYEPTPQLAVMHDGLNSYWMKCPTCKNYSDTYEDVWTQYLNKIKEITVEA